MKYLRIGGLGILGIAAAIFGFMGVSKLLPSPHPLPGPTPVVAVVKAHRAPTRHSTQSSAIPAPNAMEPINYNLFMSILVSAGHSLHMTVLVPQSSYTGTTLEEAYADDDILNLQYNNMIVMESPDPIASTYRPTGETAVTLGNGATAEWEFIPGGGGPTHRLEFEVSGTYIRLQLYHPQVNNSLSSTEEVANTFSSVN